ncbi:MAG: ribosome silencing factor [Planctomycetota bacterium]
MARIADELKGIDIRVYDVDETLRIADYFIVITGNSRPHVKALYEEIHYRLKGIGERHARAEGLELGWWVLLDFGDVVVHLQQQEARAYYALDSLYGDCPTLDWPAVETPALPAAS